MVAKCCLHEEYLLRSIAAIVGNILLRSSSLPLSIWFSSEANPPRNGWQTLSIFMKGLR